MEDEDLQKHDYVTQLNDLIRNREGVYDFLLINKCDPSYIAMKMLTTEVGKAEV